VAFSFAWIPRGLIDSLRRSFSPTQFNLGRTLIVRRIAAVLFSLLLLASPTFAQEVKTDKDKKTKADDKVSRVPVKKGTWEITPLVGGGTGFGKRSSTQFFYAQVRFGRVLTADHGSGWVRGNFEYAFDLTPLFIVMQPPQATYGGGFSPVVLKWNFTSGRRMVPFVEITGGALWTGQDVPFGTNNFNFTPQGGFGIHFLRKKNPNQAITLTSKFLHVSNAGIADANSGINASIQFLLGYTWFKR
jgi:lipid A 3-O-deacylase